MKKKKKMHWDEFMADNDLWLLIFGIIFCFVSFVSGLICGFFVTPWLFLLCSPTIMLIVGIIVSKVIQAIKKYYY